MNKELYRKKSAMLLCAIESSIGKYIKENSCINNINQNIIDDIVERENQAGRSLLPPYTLEDLVSCTYISELLDIAISCFKETASHTEWRQLKKLSEELSITDIRNRASHSNRQFHIQDWFKLGTFASSPHFQNLALKDVFSTLLSAEKGIINDPPQEWYRDTSYEIPNNLPSKFDYTVTDLIGRREEVHQLQKDLLKPRINTIAITAPGGTGKTALVLKVLDHFSHLPELNKKFDGILFVSLKQEMQTAEGLKSMEAASTFDELRNEVFSSYCDLFNLNEYPDSFSLDQSDKKILLCIDNLETLLRDSEIEFNNFNASLPEKWKVIITSRSNVNVAQVMNLGPLKDSAAKSLALTYSRKRGTPIEDKQASNIANKCNNNPLAIKLTIDYLILGKEIPTSISSANEDIASFSFKNLVERLTDNSIKVLEILNLNQNISRPEIAQTLDLSIDDAASAISELSKTSLITRVIEEDRECYLINSTVKNFILFNERNTKIRREIKEKISYKKSKADELIISQKKKKVSPHSEYYIPEHLDQDLKILLNNTNQLLNYRFTGDKARDLFSQYNEYETIYSKHPEFHRGRARIFGRLYEYDKERESLAKAIELDPNDTASKILLGKSYHGTNDYNKAFDVYNTIIESDIVEDIKEYPSLWIVILNGYYLALLFLDHTDKILDETKNWQKEGEFSSTIGSYRAAAYRKKLQQPNTNSQAENESYINSCIKILGTCLKISGSNAALRESAKAIEEIQSLLNNKHTNFSQKIIQDFLIFCDNHLSDIIESDKLRNYRETLRNLRSIKAYNIKNPFNSKIWSKKLNPATDAGITTDDAHRKNLILVQVSKIPLQDGQNRGVLFAIDESNKSYYIHYKNVLPQINAIWHSLNEGDWLAVLPEDEDDHSGNAIPVKKCHFVNL